MHGMMDGQPCENGKCYDHQTIRVLAIHVALRDQEHLIVDCTPFSYLKGRELPRHKIVTRTKSMVLPRNIEI